jgi:hypothetical protein
VLPRGSITGHVAAVAARHRIESTQHLRPSLVCNQSAIVIIAMGTSISFEGLHVPERAELEWLLESGALGRSANLIKVLRYVCDETAAGRGDHIKEYSIAVEALGRRADFDPQTDTIVRVTFHTLRKRLQDIYDTGEGMSHPVRIVIPAGRYAVQFVHLQETGQTASLPQVPRPEGGLAPPVGPPFAPPAPPPRPSGSARVSWFWFAALVVVVLIAAILWRESHSSRSGLMGSLSSRGPVTIAGPTYILFGKGRHSYTDHSGIRWEPQPGCEGGENVPPTGAAFSGTEDSYLYDGGIRGIVRCTFHARPGLYELRLHFAEPSNLEPAHRVVSLAVNAGPTQSIDVVDRAGGDRTATTFTIPGISPETTAPSTWISRVRCRPSMRSRSCPHPRFSRSPFELLPHPPHLRTTLETPGCPIDTSAEAVTDSPRIKSIVPISGSTPPTASAPFSTRCPLP